MYKNLSKSVNFEYMERRGDLLRHIHNDEATLKRNLTPARLARYEAGKISRDEAVNIAFNRGRKMWDKYEDEAEAKLKEAAEAAEIESISISITWHKSRMWGYNPTAEVKILAGHRVEFYKGSASGCGYDKESAAIASALNQSAAVKKMLYDCKEAALSKGSDGENRDLIHYGAGYGALPYFEGGVGVSSHMGVFEACGLKCKVSNHTDYSDFYYIERV